MSEQKPRIGKKGAGRRIAQELSNIRRKPISKEILEIVDEISEPFGTAENDLALTAMSQTIETQLSLLGGLNLPPSEEHAKRGTYIVQ